MKLRHTIMNGIYLFITLGCMLAASCQSPKRLSEEKEIFELSSLYSDSVKFENYSGPRRIDLAATAVEYAASKFWDTFYILERKVGRTRAINALQDIVTRNGISMIVARPYVKAYLGEAEFDRIFASQPPTTLLYKQIRKRVLANPGNPGAAPAFEGGARE